MKVLITGGAGFIGTNLANRLVQRADVDVVVVDNLSAQVHGERPSIKLDDKVKFIRASIFETDRYLEDLEECDALVHLAAETGTAQSTYRAVHYTNVNLVGTSVLIESLLAVKRKSRKILLASSRSVYGEGAYKKPNGNGEIISVSPRSSEQLNALNWDIVGSAGEILSPTGTSETFPHVPGSVYASTKSGQESLLLSACSSINATPLIFRLQNVFGEGQSLQNPYTGIISIFYNRARQGKEIHIYEDGEESRDFIHVEDVCKAFEASLFAEHAYGEVFNLGAGEPTSVYKLASSLLEVSGIDVPIKVTAEFRHGDIRHCYSDNTKFDQHFPAFERITLLDGLGRFCNWASTEEEYQDKSEVALNELKELGLTGN